ncbi:MAG: DNA alkylation repair protein [Anaerovoracaceae bacterium]
MREKILAQLKSCREADYKKFNCKLIPGIDIEKVIGIRVPDIRKVAKELAKENFLEYINQLPKDCFFEERLIHGMLIGYGKMKVDKRLELLIEFVPYIDNWATCDTVIATQKWVSKNEEVVWEFLQEFLRNDEEFRKKDKEFIIRFGVVMLLDYYINERYIDRALESLQKINNPAYYVMMGVAWCLCLCYIRFPEKTEAVLKWGQLDDTTQNKTIQKIRESYRVSKERKEKVLKYKRK